MNEALKQLENLLQNAAAGQQPFPPNSRYNGVAVLSYAPAGSEAVAYLARRFIPAAERFGTLAQHVVVEGDRLDNLAARYLGDAEQYWKLCDGNGASWPQELTAQPGRSLRIPLPEGLQP